MATTLLWGAELAMGRSTSSWLSWTMLFELQAYCLLAEQWALTVACELSGAGRSSCTFLEFPCWSGRPSYIGCRTNDAVSSHEHGPSQNVARAPHYASLWDIVNFGMDHFLVKFMGEAALPVLQLAPSTLCPLSNLRNLQPWKLVVIVGSH